MDLAWRLTPPTPKEASSDVQTDRSASLSSTAILIWQGRIGPRWRGPRSRPIGRASAIISPNRRDQHRFPYIPERRNAVDFGISSWNLNIRVGDLLEETQMRRYIRRRLNYARLSPIYYKAVPRTKSLLVREKEPWHETLFFINVNMSGRKQN